MLLVERVLSIVGDTPDQSAWERLIRLFTTDREAFYLLAGEQIGAAVPASIRDVATLATLVRAVTSETFEIADTHEGPLIKTRSGKQVLVPGPMLDRVTQFLREVDGKTTTGSGRDYEGKPISEAEARFKLGDTETWDRERAELHKQRTSRPRVLKVSDGDLTHLRSHPAYVTHQLLQCARRVILAPTSVFKGLRRGDGSEPDVDNGWAYCGKPRRVYLNDGAFQPAPNGMVYVVYSDSENFVFDWDWVAEDPHGPGYPLDWNLRFGNPHPLDTDLVLDLPGDLQPGRFDATRACYSRRGDCIFCYMTDGESFAERINPDLTVFRGLQKGEYTGFKIKNIRRILSVDKNIVIKDAPGLTVSVDAVLFASFKRSPDQSSDVYQVLIKALYKSDSEPPVVEVPPELAPFAA